MHHRNIDSTLKAAVRKIASTFRPEKIILFGSQAWGMPGPDSDVDLFIVAKTDNTRQLACDIDVAIFPRKFPLDLIVYTPEQVRKRKEIGDPFIQEILSKGKVLYALEQ